MTFGFDLCQFRPIGGVCLDHWVKEDSELTSGSSGKGLYMDRGGWKGGMCQTDLQLKDLNAEL